MVTSTRTGHGLTISAMALTVQRESVTHYLTFLKALPRSSDKQVIKEYEILTLAIWDAHRTHHVLSRVSDSSELYVREGKASGDSAVP